MKARVETAYGEWVERIPAWAKWATQVSMHLHAIQILRSALSLGCNRCSALTSSSICNALPPSASLGDCSTDQTCAEENLAACHAVPLDKGILDAFSPPVLALARQRPASSTL